MELAKYIDHTLLKAESTQNDLDKICSEALQYGFAAVCVNPCNVAYCAGKLKGSRVKVASVIGFPLGASVPLIKELETLRAMVDGAEEFDMVINIGALKDRNDEAVFNDIRTVVHAAEGKTVKVIIETGLLSPEEKIRACRLALKAGAHFVKTSTGFGKGGATVEDVRLMKKTVGDAKQVKPSGGVRSYEDA
ncbi:MAG: deoxyribose-phosphate aldolase, partial [bacterium]|nr:deoxyribose-phosphate aldolase [bacterium]